MQFDYYCPTFRNVLIQEIKTEKTEGGIYIPSTSFTPDQKEYLVFKTGKDCITIKAGDMVRLSPGIRPDELTLVSASGAKQQFGQVMEQQVTGYERKKNGSIRNAPAAKPKVTGSRKLQKG